MGLKVRIRVKQAILAVFRGVEKTSLFYVNAAFDPQKQSDKHIVLPKAMKKGCIWNATVFRLIFYMWPGWPSLHPNENTLEVM